MRGLSALLSAPFISLYAAAVGAIALSAGRARWGSATWFPMAVGVVAAAAIIPLKHLLSHALLEERRPTNDWARIVFFLIAAILPLVGVPFIVHRSPLLVVAVLCMSAFFLYGSLGTLLKLPGFRPPMDESDTCMDESDACSECGHDLTANTGDVCPQCGMVLDTDGHI